jgi:hypothetical protein
MDEQINAARDESIGRVFDASQDAILGFGFGYGNKTLTGIRVFFYFNRFRYTSWNQHDR